MLTTGSPGAPNGRDRVLIAVLAALFLVPGVVLVIGEEPSRFGFQMYSGYGVVDASWEDRAGVVHPVELAEHVASDRIEVDWTTRLPEALCARLPDAVRVEVRQTRPGGADRRSVRC